MGYPGDRIALRRQQLRLSQEELANEIGSSQKQVSRYENGHNDPTSEVLVKFARALDTTTDWLLGLTDNPERSLRDEGDLSPDERELLEIYREKPIEKRRQMRNVAKAL